MSWEVPAMDSRDDGVGCVHRNDLELSSRALKAFPANFHKMWELVRMLGEGVVDRGREMHNGILHGQHVHLGMGEIPDILP
jgi:hypothetical protein